MICPPYFADEHVATTHRVLTHAMTAPGQIHHLPETGINMVLIAEAMLHSKASFYTSDSSLRPAMALSGAQEHSADQAMYQFYPTCGDRELSLLQQAPLGASSSMTGATLVIGCQIGEGGAYTLHSTEIESQRIVHIDGLPRHFWSSRRFACRAGLGWNIYLVDGPQVIGLPRSVQIEPLYH